MRSVLRALAIAIALAAAIDPPWTIMARGRPRVAVVVQHPENRRERQLVENVTARLARDVDVVAGEDESADATVVVGTEYQATGLSDRQRVYSVSAVPATRGPDVRVSAVRAPRDAPSGTLIHLEADVEAQRASGIQSVATVRAGESDVVVAQAAHTWTGSPDRWRATFDVTPLGPPPWRLHVAVSAASGEDALDDNAADVLIDAAEPARVLVFEPRLSWASTFARRAIERDARFDVTSVSYPSRGIAVSSGGPPTLQSTMRASVRVVVVGGLDRLTSQDAQVPLRFMREQGGSVVLVPDSLADVRAAARWLPVPGASEVLLEKPARLAVEGPSPAFDASELLRFDVSPLSRALVRTSGGNEPVVSIEPVGAGRLVVSGALDAWRSRGEDASAFDRFWQAVLYGAAMDAPPPIDVTIDPSVASPGQRIDVHVRVRRDAVGLTAADPLPVSATIQPGGDPVRLWPEPMPDSFHGSFVAGTESATARFSVAVETRASASKPFLVAKGARGARPEGSLIALLAQAHGGVAVTPERLDDLLWSLLRDVKVPEHPVERRPMRSMWWITPLVACLAGEWWIRRLSGLR